MMAYLPRSLREVVSGAATLSGNIGLESAKSGHKKASRETGLKLDLELYNL